MNRLAAHFGLRGSMRLGRPAKRNRHHYPSRRVPATNHRLSINSPSEGLSAVAYLSDLLPFCESTVSVSLGGGANRLLRRFAGSGESVMVTLRPVIFGSISTCDMPDRSSRTFS